MLIAPDTGSTMYGDGAALLDHAKGGNDTLISGKGNDRMWGDAATVAPTAQTGADTFVFSPPNGQDQIMDFQPGQDHIELKGFGFNNFNDVASHIQDTPNGALITFDANDSVLIVGVHHLSASDFLLA
jgi:Ca2+-binding RTX toxin-like protein